MLGAAKAYYINFSYVGDVCPAEPPVVGVVFLRHRWVVLVRSDGVPTRKEKISREDYFTAVAVSIRVFFARLLAVAASDVTDS